MHSVCMSTSLKVQYVQRRSLELLFQSYDLLRFGCFPGIMYNLKSSKHWRQNGRCCQSVTELTLLQEQPKTAMEEAGVPWLDSCTCFDHCPGSLKDHARSGNYHPLATCWRHLASSFQCHWLECMRQALILKQEHPKASLEEAAVVFWGLVTRVCMLFMRHHHINILWRQSCF